VSSADNLPSGSLIGHMLYWDVMLALNVTLNNSFQDTKLFGPFHTTRCHETKSVSQCRTVTCFKIFAQCFDNFAALHGKQCSCLVIITSSYWKQKLLVTTPCSKKTSHFIICCNFNMPASKPTKFEKQMIKWDVFLEHGVHVIKAARNSFLFDKL